jgi:hypothetical protein
MLLILVHAGLTLTIARSALRFKLEVQWAMSLCRYVSLCRSPFVLLWGNLTQNLPYVPHTKFWFISLSRFREDFDSFGQAVSEEKTLEIDQPETRISYGSHVWKQIGTKWAISIDDLPRMFSTTVQFICERGFREEDFLEINQSERRIGCRRHVC